MPSDHSMPVDWIESLWLPRLLKNKIGGLAAVQFRGEIPQASYSDPEDKIELLMVLLFPGCPNWFMLILIRLP